MRLTIMSYNIQSGRNAFKRLSLEEAPEIISKYRPDVCGLMEVRKCTGDLNGLDQAKFIAERTNMYYAFAKAIDYLNGEYGVALLSRFPIEEFTCMPVPSLPQCERDQRYEDRVLLKAVLRPNGKRVCIFVTHYGLSEKEQENACELTVREIQKEKDPTIFMGDLNITPDHPLIHKLKAYLTDTAGNKQYYTYSSENLFQRIDYIFVSPNITPVNHYAPHSMASDHIPVITEVEI